MEKADMARRVERILRGTADARDLDRLFIWLRFKAFGCRIVPEIGHFAAHIEDRTKGLVHEIFGSYIDMMAFTVKHKIEDPSAPITVSADEIYTGAYGTIDSYREENFVKHFGLSKRESRRRIDKIRPKVVGVENNRFISSGPYNQKNADLLNQLTSVIHGGPLFNIDDLIADLRTALSKNGLLTDAEFPQLEEQRRFLALYIIEKLHGTTVATKIGPARIFAMVDHTERQLNLYLAADYPYKEGTVNYGVCLFQSGYSADEVLEGAEAYRDGQPIDEPIELGPDRLIHLLRSMQRGRLLHRHCTMPAYRREVCFSQGTRDA